MGLTRAIGLRQSPSAPCDASLTLGPCPPNGRPVLLGSCAFHSLFLPPIEKGQVKRIYHEAQFELLQDNDYGFDTYFLNPGPARNECLDLLRTEKYNFKVWLKGPSVALLNQKRAAGVGPNDHRCVRHPTRSRRRRNTVFLLHCTVLQSLSDPGRCADG